MVDVKDNQEQIKSPEKVTPRAEQAVHFNQEGERPIEKNERFFDDARVSDELRREIEMMRLNGEQEKEIEAKVEKIEFLGEKEKIEHLLDMAREKGLVFAIQVARKMNEPYLLDTLHDTLAREGFYKDFVSNASKEAGSKGIAAKGLIAVIIIVIIFCIFIFYKLWR